MIIGKERLEKELKQEKEKNNRLEKFIENGEYTWKQKYKETFDYVRDRFIDKDKIRAKIKELEEKSDYWNCDEIEVLKELLEE